MALYTTTSGTDGLLELFQSGLVAGVGHESAAVAASGVIATDDVRVEVPVVDTDAAVAWHTEGSAITDSTPSLRTIKVVPSVLAGITAISNTAVLAGSKDLATISINSLARDLDRKIDAAFLSTVAAPAPAGLTSLTEVTALAPTAFTNLDPFIEGMTQSRLAGANLTAWIAHPSDLQRILELKDSASSSRPLVEPDVTQTSLSGAGIPSADSGIRLFGVPVYISAQAAAGTVWGIDRAQVITVKSASPRLESSRDAGFSTDTTLVRAVINVGWAITNEPGIIKLTLPAEA